MKKTLATVTMALVLGSSTAFAQRGIIIADKSAGTKENTCMTSKDGIIIADRSGIIGGLIAVLEGIIIADKGAAPCSTAKDGIIIADRGGIIIAD
jgi:hypothetical protein